MGPTSVTTPNLVANPDAPDKPDRPDIGINKTLYRVLDGTTKVAGYVNIAILIALIVCAFVFPPATLALGITFGVLTATCIATFLGSLIPVVKTIKAADDAAKLANPKLPKDEPSPQALEIGTEARRLCLY
ncbi:MAG: hypothetical protein S4CHLAM20_10580 [Chlamydiia bacterium]|nr:hypothetical protein [Chlamydiia bacterium]